MTEKTLTFQEFQSRINQVAGPGVIYREQGRDGWDRLDFDENGPCLVHENGPHWCDAAPPASWYSYQLLGTYDFNTGKGKFFALYHHRK